jgi:transposase
MDETGGPTGNADGKNLERKGVGCGCGVVPALAVFHLALSLSASQPLSLSAEVAIHMLGEAFAGVVLSDHYGTYSWLPLQPRQICWTHIQLDITAIAERTGASAQVGARLLELEWELYEQWHRWRDGLISLQELQTLTTPIRGAVETMQREVSELGFAKQEKILWTSTVRSYHLILNVSPSLGRFWSNPEWSPGTTRWNVRLDRR